MSDSSHWIYSAVIVSILTGAVGVGVSGLVLRRIVLGRRPRPAVALLIFSLLLLALSQMAEQIRVLFFRLSYDQILDSVNFQHLYMSTWNVTASKVMSAVALSVAAAVKLGLYCDHTDDELSRWAINAAAATFVAWAVLAALLDPLLR